MDDSDNNKVAFPTRNNISTIKNKQRRSEKFLEKLKHDEKLKKKIKKERKNDKNYVKQLPRTIENTRVIDDNLIDPEDDEIQLNQCADEMAIYFNKEIIPKILITTSDNPHTNTILFARELKQTIPNTEFRWRNRSSLKKTVVEAINHGFTDLIAIKEDRRVPSGLLHVHLPDGPTAYYRISSHTPCEKIKNAAAYSSHRPEVIINNFTTQLSDSLLRMLASVFHYDPEFAGRRVVSFTNQRDYIFFRHYRYEFKNGERAPLQEIGPSFTLRLQYLLKGTFDTRFGDYEWVPKQDEKRINRRKFVL